MALLHESSGLALILVVFLSLALELEPPELRRNLGLEDGEVGIIAQFSYYMAMTLDNVSMPVGNNPLDIFDI
jgi:hypothetical protein